MRPSVILLSLSLFGFSLFASTLFACAASGDRAAAAPAAAQAKLAAGVAAQAKLAAAAAAAERSAAEAFAARVSAASRTAALPPALADTLLLAARSERAALAAEIDSALSGDPFLVRLVDKKTALPADYAPADLVPLSGGSYIAGRAGMLLREAAARSLEAMAAAAHADGISLVVSSAYRSYAYQQTVRARVEAELGEAAADRESARAGQSQHQLGLAVDFGSIDDSFAETSAAAWLTANASRRGWSLSYPKGLETVTGYRWESWHYRYLGTAAAALAQKRFGGVQQYALEFLDAWGRGSR